MPNVPEDPEARQEFRLLNTSTTQEGVVRGREAYHLKDRLRTKPGRNDAETTESLSCSDKLVRWSYLGLQGAALSAFFALPIYLDSLIIGRGFDEAALVRCFARLDDVSAYGPFAVHVPEFFETGVSFPHEKSDTLTLQSPLGAIDVHF